MTAYIEQIAANLADVRRRMAEACARAGRPESSVTLVAVTKYARDEWVEGLIELGVRDLGESRPQQLAARAEIFVPSPWTRQGGSDERWAGRGGAATIRWHLVGHLQRNKVRRVLPLAELIHSVDTLRLLTYTDSVAGELALRPRVLLEVNVSGEGAKDGLSAAELRAAWPQVLACRHVQVEGLMTMAPLCDNSEDARPVFRALRLLRDELVQQSPPGRPLPHLSIGMSGDFEVAIEEGATLVRIGSGLFDGLR